MLKATRSLLIVLALLLAACAPIVQRAGIPTQWRASPNFDERRPNFVIIHHTTNDNADQALRTLTDPARGVSAHYLVGRNGTVYQLVDERARAWHAGASKWGSETDVNSSSLGIELDNNGHEPFPEAQISALLALLADIQNRYRIPRTNFLGHADVAPRRKVDPSGYFPWKTLADRGFGLWCDPPFPDSPLPPNDRVQLQALGYDVSNLDAAIHAFKLHFVQDGDLRVLTDGDRALLRCLLEQKDR